MGIGGIIDALARGLRALLGLQDGETVPAVLIGVYTFLALTALALLFAWLTDTPLTCMTQPDCPS